MRPKLARWPTALRRMASSAPKRFTTTTIHCRGECARLCKAGCWANFASPTRTSRTGSRTTPDQIRYRIELGGGSTMDLGCYPLHFLRHSFGAEPEVVSARAATVHEHIDLEIVAELLFPGDIPARIWSRMNPAGGFSSAANFYGDRGRLKVVNPMVPQREPHLIELVTSWGTRRETLTTRPTFDYQLQAFIDAIEGVRPMPTDAEDGVVSMRVIDNVYRAAGMRPPRPDLDSTHHGRPHSGHRLADQLSLPRSHRRQRPELPIQRHRRSRRNRNAGTTPRSARSVRRRRRRGFDHAARARRVGRRRGTSSSPTRSCPR